MTADIMFFSQFSIIAQLMAIPSWA